ncbi:hypothetical protein CV_0888 [Chromobacterium violaceum ATCC 12472]|uniref:Uncharacterized protein n=1 Tax=Chromobacterium violaceum (strain ATCC 12472 / DSM 30191 / JCM 1249 / CCUG 213 / NBRC 12614 / NCIMB 9131 / NCTC 9757 / MK) TaxID=243365 RepID=Q7NZN4_CHRVO|nr:hypothetical protein CV_0888 [Chromobacterium violaceum ATCC 12472]
MFPDDAVLPARQAVSCDGGGLAGGRGEMHPSWMLLWALQTPPVPTDCPIAGAVAMPIRARVAAQARRKHPSVCASTFSI